jgi:hypothetical protein
VAELQQAMTAAEVRATVTLPAERARLEKVISVKVRVPTDQDSLALFNSQEDSSEVRQHL